MPAHYDAVTTWLPDPSHYPEQMTPLSASVWFEAMGSGLHEAMRELRGPFGGFRTRVERGWAYESELEPEWEHDPDRVRAHALGLGERWERELRPRVREITAELEQMRPDLPPPDEAAALLDRLWALVREQWRLHFLTVIPAQMSAEILAEAYAQQIGGDDELAPYRLLEGMPNAPDAEVALLADRARELGVDDLVRDFAPAPALARLRGLAPGRVWLRALDDYLLRYGGRARWHELSLPREAEFPVLTLEAVRLVLERDGTPPTASPPPPPPQLAELAERVRAAYALKESHSYDIDYPGLLATREALLAFGRRLVGEGLLDGEDDVWMLRREELREELVATTRDLRALVAERRQELAEGRRDGPQPFLGDPPDADERHAVLEKFYGSGGRGLTGTPASPGSADGVARVVASTADFGRVRAGDVLVTTTTTPAWTPLFPSLSALVTETGGILSHAAVVAREYGLPAVVGVTDATRLVADGARVHVDGDRGSVTLV